MSRRHTRPSLRRTIGCLLVLPVLLGTGCDALGNPPQRVTPAELWSQGNDKISTTSQSFSDAATIERLLREGLGELDYVDPAIGETKTLTLVTAVPNLAERRHRGEPELLTLFEFASGRKLERRWWGRSRKRAWKAAFALPEPPKRAVTAVAPVSRLPSP